MKCPFCGRAELRRVVRDVALEFKDQHSMVADVSGDFCEACGEMILAEGETDRVGSALQELQQRFEQRLV
ncbi:type II toxin-antitoxin system MqsA family antitoxin [Pseudoduganella sp.]|uniref:type II toxin-antitoxin system MqsA family antitoxin n=1 Tax=Pseudoduganella sp. TaxID=1880898 RepID=UPI0035B285A0